MPLCKKCKVFLPPDFVDESNICLFCERYTESLPHEGRMVTKREIELEYKMFIEEIVKKREISTIMDDSRLKKMVEAISN